MLSRTAQNLFWIGRYLERAETAARLLDVGARMSLLPNTTDGYQNEWESLLRAAGAGASFKERYGEFNEENIEEFLFFDTSNPSSVASCIGQARENGRIVRTALTSQVWDALNVAFQELRRLRRQSRGSRELSDLTEWTTRQCSAVRGAIDATQLRNDGWHFMGLGYALERADSTARLIDVKYYVLLPGVEFVGSGRDSYQWQVLLRSLSAHRAFHWAYGGDISAGKVAHFLILNRECPRSLINSVITVVLHLQELVERYGDDAPVTARDTAHEMLRDLRSHDIESIFDEGLHEYLSRFIRENAVLANKVHADYLRGIGS